MGQGIEARELHRFVRALPKAEVHLHLEGCVPTEVASRAAQQQGATAPVPSVDGRPDITDLQELLDYLDWSCSLIHATAQLEEIAYATSVRLGKSGALYADLIFNPSHWPHWRRRVGEMVEGLSAGFAAAETDGHPPVGLCLSLKRQQTASEAHELVDFMIEARLERLVALSIDGNEAAGSHNERFVEAFGRAERAGFHRCAHAGESSGATGVLEAIELLGAERIDHGIRSIEDASVIQELVSRRVPLDVCPTSNVVLGIVPSIHDHPVEKLRAAGVAVSLNTDDPVLYGIELTGEYELVGSTFGLETAQLGEMARTSIEACFASPDLKAGMLAQLENYLAATAAD